MKWEPTATATATSFCLCLYLNRCHCLSHTHSLSFSICFSVSPLSHLPKYFVNNFNMSQLAASFSLPIVVKFNGHFDIWCDSFLPFFSLSLSFSILSCRQSTCDTGSHALPSPALDNQLFPGQLGVRRLLRGPLLCHAESFHLSHRQVSAKFLLINVLIKYAQKTHRVWCT